MSRFLLNFFGFFCFLVAVIYLCDVSYLFHGVRCTYLRGETSAQIDDHQFFYNRKVYSLNGSKTPLSTNFKDSFENKNLEFALENSKTVSFILIKNDSVLLEKYWGIGGEDVLTNSFSM